MNRYILGPILTAALTISSVSDAAYADSSYLDCASADCASADCASADCASADCADSYSNDEKTEAEYSKAFDGMIQRLEAHLKKTKRSVYTFDSQLPKMQKRAETAKYRVTAARERYDEVRQVLASNRNLPPPKQEKLKKTMQHQRSLLSKDATNLEDLLAQSVQYRTDMATLSAELKKLSDDVAIEATRFPEEDRRQKKAAQLVADAEWALNKMAELTPLYESEFEEPTKETVSQTQVSD
jgi:peptidoglycan hydrolase CwlO-like protein